MKKTANAMNPMNHCMIYPFVAPTDGHSSGTGTDLYG